MSKFTKWNDYKNELLAEALNSELRSALADIPTKNMPVLLAIVAAKRGTLAEYARMFAELFFEEKPTDERSQKLYIIDKFSALPHQELAEIINDEFNDGSANWLQRALSFIDRFRSQMR